MTEQAIESVAVPVIEGVVKALTPEAAAILREVHAFAAAEYQKLDAEFPQLVERAKDDAEGAIGTATDHLLRVVSTIAEHLGLGPAPASTPDPTSAVPAPQP